MYKINIKIIIFQLVGIILLIQSFMQLKIASELENYLCMLQYSKDLMTDCWHNKLPLGEFISEILMWRVYGYVFGATLISLLNWKNKISFLNSLIVIIPVFVLFPIEFFSNEFVKHTLFIPNNLLVVFFTNHYAFAGCLYLIAGLFFILIPINNKPKPYHTKK